MKTVVFVGVESTGKSTMSVDIGQYFNAPVVPEYAREYLDTFGTNYDFKDFVNIAHGQMWREIVSFQMFKNQPLLILDTDFIVIKIWNDIVFGNELPWIEDRIKSYDSRLYCLMTPDIAWEDDGMREYPDEKIRWQIHSEYKSVLEDFSLPFVIINGQNHSDRKHQALKAISDYLKISL